MPRGPAWCAAPRPVRSHSVLQSAFPTLWCLSPSRGLLPPDLLGGWAEHAEAGRVPGSLCLPLAPTVAVALGSLRVVPVRGPAMGLSLAGPSGVGLGLRVLRWLPCVDPVTDASGFPYRPSFDGGLGRCTGAVSCGRRHLPLRGGGRHARLPCVRACAPPSWPASSGLGLPLSWSLVCPPPVAPLPIPPPLFFFSGPFCLLLSLVSGPGCLGPWRFVFLPPPPPPPLVFFCAPPLSLGFSGFRPRVPRALALCAVCFARLPLLGSPCPLAPCAGCPGGCSPPPLSCLAVSVAASRCSVFFVRPRCLWLSLLSAPGAMGSCATACLFCWPPASLLSVRSRLAVGRSLVVAAPHPRLLSRCFGRRRSVLLLFFFFALSFCAPVVSCFLFFPALVALGLGAVCCLFWWPPASRLAVRSRLCFPPGRWRLPGGCCPASPAFVSRGFRRCLSLLGFFFLGPHCLGLSLVFGPGCPGPWRCVLFFFFASRFSARCALPPLLCLPPGRGLLPGVCCPPPPFVSRRCLSALTFCVFFFLCAPVLFAFFRFPAPGALGLGAVFCLFPARLVVVSCVLLRPASCPVFLRCVVRFVLCLVLCGVLVSCWVLAPFCVGSCCPVFVVLCWRALLRSLAGFFFCVVPCLSVVLRAVSVPVLCLCDAVPVCLRRCSSCVALLPLRRWLVFCPVVCCVCVFAAGPGRPLLSPGGSWWVLVLSFGGVLWCVPGCCAVPCCCVSCRLALCCCALCCFLLLCLVLSRAVSCPGALSVVLSSCAFGAVFCLVSPRCVCFAVVCCHLALFAAVFCAVCVLGCRAVRSLSSPPCAVLLCVPALPWCPAPLCCAAMWFCVVLLPYLFGFSYL